MRRVLLSLAMLATACVNTGEIVVKDRATALEDQASGSFDELERRLDRAAIEPRPVPLTPEQLQALGARPASLVDESDLTDADRIDGLLAQHCVGEGKEGLLVDTHDACKGAADPEEAARLIDRINRARKQLWHWMHDQRADVTEADLQRAWHQRHMQGVVCGGWVEGDDGKWQAKAC
jgi:uncharacterized protein YdbL (DUF1318 family)